MECIKEGKGKSVQSFLHDQLEGGVAMNQDGCGGTGFGRNIRI